MSSIDERLMDLESRLAFQEQAIAELSDEIARQQRTIVALERAAKSLEDQLRVALPSLVASAAEETPPPHY